VSKPGKCVYDTSTLKQILDESILTSGLTQDSLTRLFVYIPTNMNSQVIYICSSL